VPALSSVAWSAITVMAFLNPSGTEAVSWSGTEAIGACALGAVAAFALPCLALRAEDGATLVRRAVFALIALLAMAWAFAIVCHRDFLVFATQAILIVFLTVLLKLETILTSPRRRAVYRATSTAAFVTFVLWTGWLMMMSYAIVTRDEPRWIESIAYNLVNGLIALGLLIAAATLRDRERRSLTCRNGVVHLDERDISAILSPQENRIVVAFLTAPSHRHTCRSLLAQLRTTPGFDPTDAESVAALPDDPAVQEAAVDCDRCIDERWTATNCAAYRNLKNRISATKKYLELLQIGTIVPVSENAREIKERGWLLRLFDDVRVV
jgi:hypothetical protein